MAAHFDLIITADNESRTAEFTLKDATGAKIGFHHVDFTKIPVSRQQGLFDLQVFIRLYVEASREASAVGEIGVCIAEELLGA